MKVELKRVNDAVHLEGTGTSNVKIHMDGSPEIGGQDLGARPMELVLMALGSCASMDLISILQKQRQKIEDYTVSIEGRRRDEVPKIFTSIHMEFVLKGNIDQAKAAKAAELAVKKYCSVHDMLAKGGIEITYEIRLQ
ncbi:MAG: OsmC family protein [Sphingobacteriaceae bacterium]|jgi:putative redox protein|nr:OsmC family protein [Sphingobacteriaceae bacterium]